MHCVGRGRNSAEETGAVHQPGSHARSGERASGYPAVYTEIKLVYRVGGKVSHKAVEDAVRLSKEKYCSVSAMLEKTAKITSRIE